MKFTFTIGLCLVTSITLMAQNNQINWSRNRALQDGTATGGLKLSGKDLYFNLVELGPMLTEHQEFKGRASNVGSFSISAANPFDGHATSVASLGAATGVSREAKGIAYESTIQNYSDATWPQIINDINNPFRDIRQRLVVNSSFSRAIDEGNSSNALTFGTYDRVSNTIDDIAWRNPFCLQVVSAGNSGEITNTKPNTFPQTWQYDKLPGNAQTAKNTLAVGNIYDMSLDPQNQINYAFVSVSSSAGPTDDMRIKPELCAPGNQLVVANRENVVSDNYYKSYRTNPTGTSLSAPVVTGTALLLQELYFNRNKQYMRAATVKGLLMHTADKIYYYANGGNSATVNWGISTTQGPDPFCGYGLINATAAAQAILTRGKGNSSIIDEKTLYLGKLDVVDISTTPGQPVTVSISWTDPARYDANAAFTVTTNDLAPTLVNDLGVIVVERLKGTKLITRTFFPYSLMQQNQKIITVSDRQNRVDPYEKIRFIPLPDCTYSIIVSPENAILWGGQQPYSLIVTGLGLDQEHVKPSCEPSRSIKEAVRVGVNEEAKNQITISADITPEAGLTEFNALDLVLIDGALVRNPDALLMTVSCTGSGLRKAAEQSTNSIELLNLLNTIEVGEETLRIYPNPLDEQCTLSSKEAIKTITVYSMDGKLQLQQQGLDAYEVQVSTTSLPSGMYIFVVEGATGQRVTKKMTKL